MTHRFRLAGLLQQPSHQFRANNPVIPQQEHFLYNGYKSHFIESGKPEKEINL